MLNVLAETINVSNVPSVINCDVEFGKKTQTPYYDLYQNTNVKGRYHNYLWDRTWYLHSAPVYECTINPLGILIYS